MIRSLSKLITYGVVIISGGWCYFDFSWEPVISLLVGILGVLALFITGKKRQENQNIMKQRGGKNSNNYQASGNISIKK